MLNFGWVRARGSVRRTATRSFLAICLLSFSTTTSAYFCANPADYQEYFLPDYASAFKACADDQNNSWDGNWYTRSCTGNAYQSAYGRYAMETVQIGSWTPCKRYWYPDAACPAGQSFEGPPPGECKGKYKIEIVGEDGRGASRGEIEPGRPLPLRAVVYDQSGQSVAGITVSLKSEVIEKTGGHNHHDTTRPKGTVPSAGTTASEGFAFTFNSGAELVAGDHKVTARCSDCEGPATYDIWVGIRGLVPLSASASYVFVGKTGHHPSNHYMAEDASKRVRDLAAAYHRFFPNDPVLRLNDASLERGGRFDIASESTKAPRPWAPPHKTHLIGRNIDVRANPHVNDDAIPHRNFFDFEDLVAAQNGRFLAEDMESRTGHYHLSF